MMIDRPDLKGPLVHLGFDGRFLASGIGFQVAHLDLVVEVTDIAYDGLVFHLLHVGPGDHLIAAGGGHEDVADGRGVFHGGHFEAFHGRLQGADGIDLRHQHPGTVSAHGMGAALAHVAVAADHHHLAGHHDIRGPLDAVGQGFTATVQVVEFGLGHRIVDVESRKEKLAALGQLVEPVNAGGGLLGNAFDRCGDPGPETGILGMPAFRRAINNRISSESYSFCSRDGSFSTATPWWTNMVASPPSSTIRSGPLPSGQTSACSVHHQYSFQGFPLPGENGGRPLAGNGRSRMVLGGKDVAGGPADVGAENLQGIDEHGGLDGHVQAAGDLQAFERLLGSVFFTNGHQPGHFVFRQLHLLVTKSARVRSATL
jgi:hypothetical protein